VRADRISAFFADNVREQEKFLEALSQQGEHKTKLQFGASPCG